MNRVGAHAALTLLLLASALAPAALADTAETDIPLTLLTARCAFCHGAAGISRSPLWPTLAGQDRDYLLEQLKLFRSGVNDRRQGPAVLQMRFVLRGLTDTDLQRIAAYYASMPPRDTPASPADEATDAELLARGRRIYQGGQDPALACAACHGSATAPAVAGVPRLQGQFAGYLVQQLMAYRSGTRRAAAGGMNEFAMALAADDLQAVAAFIAAGFPN